MYVRRFQLTSFRNYRTLDFTVGPGHLLFLGDNAQGKSNLLEALYILASGRSPRALHDVEMIGWGAESEGQPFARIQAQVDRREGPVALETIVVGASHSTGSEQAQPPAPPTRAGKRYRVNGIARRGVDFVGQLRAVLFTADDLEIISGPPSTRRAYLDSALTQLDRAYYAAQHRYTRILQQRNATLKRIKEGIAGPDELALWDPTFVREGATLVAVRHNALRRLRELASSSHAVLSGASLEDLELTYEPALGDEMRGRIPDEATIAEVEQVFETALAGQRRRETAAGLSLVGPHRDDFTIKLNGVPAASFGSRAQIRTAALAIRLAEAELLRARDDDPPVLLLDDIVSELDARRRDSVLAGLAGFDQVWFTATTGTSLPPDFLANTQTFTVANGTLTPGSL